MGGQAPTLCVLNHVTCYTQTTPLSFQPCNSVTKPPQTQINACTPWPTTNISMLADSACTDILIRNTDHIGLHQPLQPTSHTMQLPNNSLIHAQGADTITIATSPTHPLSLPATIYDNDSLSNSLLGLGPIVNQGNTVILHSTGIDIYDDPNSMLSTQLQNQYSDQRILSGTKKPHDCLWPLNLPIMSTQPSHHANHVNLAIHNAYTADRVQWHNASFGACPASTFITAFKKHYITLPDLTLTQVQRNLPNLQATARGRLDRVRQGHHQRVHIQQNPASVPAWYDDCSQTDTTADVADTTTDTAADTTDDSNVVFFKLVPASATAAADLTGQLPCPSRQGDQYLLISVLDNYIHIEPMPTRTTHQYLKAFRKTIKFFRDRNRQLRAQTLDNETSTELEALLRQEVGQLRYLPPHTKRANRAERAIRTAKNHIISTMAEAPTDMPKNMWGDSIEHVELTLNHLREYDANPAISAYEGIHGTRYDFDAHPIAPFGCKVIIHDPPEVRPSWADHGTPGYYLGPALEHYRCHRIWIPTSRTTRITDTVAWYPTPYHAPGAYPEEQLTKALTNLQQSLQPVINNLPTDNNLRTDITTTIQAVQNLLDKHPLLAADIAMPEPLHNGQLPEGAQPLLPPQPAQLPEGGHPAQPPLPAQPAEDAPASAAQQRRLNAVSTTATDISVPPTVQPTDSTTNQRPQTTSSPTDHRPQPTFNQRPQPTDKIPDQRPQPTIHPLNLDDDGNPLTYRVAINGPEAAQWHQAHIVEWERIFTTKTGRPIHLLDMAVDRRGDISYYNPKPKEKFENGSKTYRIRGTIGGDKVNYPYDVRARTAHTDIIKILLTSVVSDHANFMTLDIKDFYLNHDLERPEYMRVRRDQLPPEIIEKYNLQSYFGNSNSIIIEINKGLYGLPQAGKIAQDNLVKLLRLHGYTQCEHTPCTFRHATRNITFALVVDDFGVKYSSKDDAEHLIAALQTQYVLKTNWTGDKFLGLKLDWNHADGVVKLSLPGYIDKVLTRFAHRNINPPGAASPSVYTPPQYGRKGPQPTTIDDSPLTSTADANDIQQIVGCLLYYALMIDDTMLPAVTAIASQQSQATIAVSNSVDRLLHYAAAHPNNQLVLRACDMVLHVQSDASYLSRPKAGSVVGGIFYLGNKDQPLQINGAIHACSTLLDVVVASAAEAEYGALFTNLQTAAYIRTALADLGYPQPTTTVLCDNQCAIGIANDTLKIRRSKAVDMRYHWVRDRIRQGQFTVRWIKGANNLADFFTKPLPVHAHRALMPFLVNTPTAPNNKFAPRRSSYRPRIH